MRNPKLKKLAKRLSNGQLARRAQKMASKNTRHQDIMQSMGQMAQMIDALRQLAARQIGATKTLRYLTYGNLGILALVVGRVLGWW